MTIKRVSVAMATYNGARFVSEQLESIIRQTVRPDEIIISDDNSADETVNICENVLSKSRIAYKILINPNGRGFSANFNNALSNTSGDIVFLSDQDDWWLPQRVERILKEMVTGSLIMCDMRVGSEQLEVVHESILSAANIKIERYCYGCAMVVERELLNMCLPIPFDFVQHDVWLNLVATVFGVKRVIREPLQIYRRHGRNVTPQLGEQKSTLRDRIASLRHTRSRLLKRELVLHVARSIAHHRLLDSESNTLKPRQDQLQQLDNELAEIKTRIAFGDGSILERLINASVAYKHKSIPLTRLIKDVIFMNDLWQK